MLQKAVAHYHDLLTEDALAEASCQALDHELESNRMIFGGRRLSPYLRPHFVIEDEFQRVSRICETVWGAIQKVKDHVFEDSTLLDELGLTDIERELVSIDPGYAAVSPTSRLDSFLTDDAYSFVELNAESPAGIAYADTASEIFMRLPVMNRFTEKYNVRPLFGRRLLLDTLLQAYTEYLGHKPTRPPRIAIVDLRGLPTMREFEMFRDFFEQQGFPAVVCAPDELEFTNNHLRCSAGEIDLVYKRLLVNEYLPIINEQPALLDAYRAGAVCMVNSFRSKLIHKKALFAVLTNERYAKLFNDTEQSLIRAHVPWTRSVRAEKTDHYGEQVDLLEFILKNQEQLVLKPNDDYGGHGIYIGWDMNAPEWKQAIEAAVANKDYIVQERVKTAREVFPALQADGSIEFAEQLVDLDPLLFYGKVGSAFTRLSFTELANVSSGGGMVPTLLLGQK